LPVLSILGQIAAQVLVELSAWLWILAGFTLMTIEIFSGRGVALSLALSAMITGTIAVFGASGIWPASSNTVQTIVFLMASLIIFAATNLSAKSS
jgi:membrane protein implicated in regulation of membrane protease activity